MSFEAARFIPPFFFLHQADNFLALSSARGPREAGLKLGDGILEVTRHLLEFFIYQRTHASTHFWLLQKKQEIRQNNRPFCNIFFIVEDVI